jgi:transcription elongation GreA/GreB family factor
MSRAFVKESDIDSVDLPDRPVSPHPNFVTADGLAAIEGALLRYGAAHRIAIKKDNKAAIAVARRELRYWTARRASAQVIEPGSAMEEVRFGTTVTMKRADGRTQTFRIVGEDEAEPSRGTLSHASPLARVLFGRAIGDIIEIPGGKATILKIT